MENPSVGNASGQQTGGMGGVPQVSAGLQAAASPPSVAFAKYARLVGPPPKVRAPVNLVTPDPNLQTEVNLTEEVLPTENASLMQALS